MKLFKEKLKGKERLAIITIDYANRYNVGNFHLNVELASHFKETRYFFMERGIKLNHPYFSQCDLIFINRPLRKIKHSSLEGATYRALDFRDYGIPILLFDTDTQMLSMKERIVALNKMGVTHIALGNNDKRVEDHKEIVQYAMWFPFGFNPQYFFNHNLKVRQLQSGFIGSYRNLYYGPRKELVVEFIHRLGDRFFWKRMEHVEYVNYLNNIRIFVLANDNDAGFFMKHLETMACGCMLLCQYTPLLEKLGFVNNEHLMWWNTISECEDKVLYHLAYHDERNRIAKNGEEEVKSKHTWTHRVNKLISWLETGKEQKFP